MLGFSVIHILPQACSENYVQEMNNGNKIGQSAMISVNLENR